MTIPVRRLAACLALLPILVSADERILSFHSDIEVLTNAAMTVTETIRVRSEGIEIRRGIYRDFPTRYRDARGSRITVTFDVVGVTRDGQNEPYALEDLPNGVRVRIGNADVMLPEGEHTYALSYRTDRQLGYFEAFDELYWNVTGNGWDFPIDKASARVVLPATIPPDRMKTSGYTGPEGSTETAYSVRAGEGPSVEFAATRPLGPREGLTIAVSWPKGHVYEPSRRERLGWFMQDNRSAVAALIGLVAILAYYLVVWAMVGMDPARGTIVPRFRPPEKISPAAARFVWKMGFDDRCFAAALIDLAVRGRLRLKESHGEYTLVRVDEGPSDPFPEEVNLRMNLLGNRSALRMHHSNHETIGEARDALEEDLRKSHVEKHILLNKRYWVPGLALWVLTALAVVVLGRELPVAAFMTLWVSFWTLGVLALLRSVIGQWKKVFTRQGAWPGGCLEAVGALFLTAFALPFVGGELFGLYALSGAVTPLAVVLLAAAAALMVLFYRLIKAPTMLGRRLLDELEGFRLYLSVAERDRLASMRSPEKTPELFEAYLPYALALDVEQQWAEQFAEVLAGAGEAGTAGYHPVWYHSHDGLPLAATALAGAVGGALAGAVASSATAPGSSSGSGGGGSSGGGGGGGGGGGW